MAMATHKSKFTTAGRGNKEQEAGGEPGQDEVGYILFRRTNDDYTVGRKRNELSSNVPSRQPERNNSRNNDPIGRRFFIHVFKVEILKIKIFAARLVTNNDNVCSMRRCHEPFQTHTIQE